MMGQGLAGRRRHSRRAVHFVKVLGVLLVSFGAQVFMLLLDKTMDCAPVNGIRLRAGAF